MLVGQKVKRILLAQYRVDFRKSFDGLTAEAYRMGLNILEGDAVLFFSRDRRRLKVLFADANGMWICSKRFHEGSHRARFTFLEDPQCLEITDGELMLLMEGTMFTVHKKVKPWKRAS
jgi:hypothetical protein